MLVGTVDIIIIIITKKTSYQLLGASVNLIIITIIIIIVIPNIIFTIKIILPIVGAELETEACQAFQCQFRSQTLGRRSRTHISRSVNHRVPLQSFGIIVVYHASKV